MFKSSRNFTIPVLIAGMFALGYTVKVFNDQRNAHTFAGVVYENVQQEVDTVKGNIEAIHILNQKLPEALLGKNPALSMPASAKLFRDALVERKLMSRQVADAKFLGLNKMPGVLVGPIDRLLIAPVSAEACKVITPGYDTFTSPKDAVALLAINGPRAVVCLRVSELERTKNLIKLMPDMQGYTVAISMVEASGVCCKEQPKASKKNKSAEI